MTRLPKVQGPVFSCVKPEVLKKEKVNRKIRVGPPKITEKKKCLLLPPAHTVASTSESYLPYLSNSIYRRLLEKVAVLQAEFV